MSYLNSFMPKTAFFQYFIFIRILGVVKGQGAGVVIEI